MKDKKKIAAIAGVMAFMESSGISAMPGLDETEKPLRKRSMPMAEMNPWSMSGRRDQMQMRGLMQMKSFQS